MLLPPACSSLQRCHTDTKICNYYFHYYVYYANTLTISTIMVGNEKRTHYQADRIFIASEITMGRYG